MVVRDNSDLPRARRPRSPKAPMIGENITVKNIARVWWEKYQESDRFGRDRAMPELPLRASSISKRCDRQLWYELTETPKSNPSDAASVFRMMLGQIVHDLVDEAMAELPDWNTWTEVDGVEVKDGWFVEESIDLRPAGFPGSAHSDLIKYKDGVPVVVGEIKTEGGFGFKVLTTNYKGEPEGPRWAHIMQAAMVAVAVGAPRVMIMYFALEPLSPDLAKSMDEDEFGRFAAQWVIDLDDESYRPGITWRRAVEIEARRQVRILELADAGFRPERALSVHDIPGGAIVFDPENGGKWSVVSPETGTVTQTGKTWLCGYCDWKQQCLDDGADAVQLTAPGQSQIIAAALDVLTDKEEST